MLFNEEMRRKNYQSVQKEKHKEDAERVASETENDESFDFDGASLWEESKPKRQTPHFCIICTCLIVDLIGLGFLTLGICVVSGVLLNNLLWLGIVFILLSVAILASTYPLYKKLAKK